MNVVKFLTTVILSMRLIGSTFANAGTFSVPLTLLEETAPLGHYLAANFNVGTSFSHVDSLSLEFRLPGGYESTGATTGNSSWSRTLYAAATEPGTRLENVPGANDWIPFSYSLAGIPLSRFVENVAPDSLHIFSFGPRDTWPDFIRSGQGRVALFDIVSSDFHPIQNDGATPVLSSSTTWGSLAAINSVRLSVIGTPTPEPSGAIFFAMSASCFLTLASRLAVREHERR